MAFLHNSTILLLLALAGCHHLHSVRAERTTLDLSSNTGGLEPLNNPTEIFRNGPSRRLPNPNLLRLLYENWRPREQAPSDFNAARLASLDTIPRFRVMLPNAQGNGVNYPGHRVWTPLQNSLDDEANSLLLQRFESQQPVVQFSPEPNSIQIPEPNWEEMGHNLPAASKRDSYMSMCHFKICNLGRKRRIPLIVSPNWPA